MTEFNPETVLALGVYVYALIDPRRPPNDPGRFFYIGKGTGQRCFAHAAAEVAWQREKEPNPKLQLIRDIRQATGAPPLIQVIAHDLKDDNEAFRIEAALISILQTDGNLASGKYTDDYCLSVAEVDRRYSKPLMETEIGHRVLLVSLNGGADLPPFPEIVEADMPRRILMYWPISQTKADQVEYIIGVYQQITRRVYKVHQSEDGNAVHERVEFGRKKNGHPNWKRVFRGEPCREKESQWGGRRILGADGRVLTKFPRRVGHCFAGVHSRNGAFA